jgi:hypothetical protein
MDEFDAFDPEGNADFDAEGLEDDPDAALDEFDDEEPGEDDLDGFAFDEAETDFDDASALEEDFTVDAEYDEAADEDGASGDETAYAATYEDLLVDEADNPPSFPPELDLDVPEPVDGYPWVDLDVLGSAEAEPWVNTVAGSSVDASEFAIADVDDPAASALARFWQG